LAGSQAPPLGQQKGSGRANEVPLFSGRINQTSCKPETLRTAHWCALRRDLDASQGLRGTVAHNSNLRYIFISNKELR
jgi:hypothetical protein